jgi:hypothetical protein
MLRNAFGGRMAVIRAFRARCIPALPLPKNKKTAAHRTTGTSLPLFWKRSNKRSANCETISHFATSSISIPSSPICVHLRSSVAKFFFPVNYHREFFLHVKIEIKPKCISHPLSERGSASRSNTRPPTAIKTFQCGAYQVPTGHRQSHSISPATRPPTLKSLTPKLFNSAELPTLANPCARGYPAPFYPPTPTLDPPPGLWTLDFGPWTRTVYQYVYRFITNCLTKTG